jgi:hypothetical protein
MKKSLHTLFMIAILLASLACATLTSGNAVPVSEDTEVPVNTLPPLQVDTVAAPTQKSTNTAAPVDPPTIAQQEFFTEEFESDAYLDQWYYYTTGPGEDNDDDLQIFQDGDGLTFDLGALDLYVYHIYDLQTYKDVRLTMVAENLGRNNNNVSMVCRLDYDNAQWYEFSVESGGVWYLYAYDGGYNTLDSGGTNALKQGKAVNEYGLECSGNTITMFINGDKVKTYTDRTYVFGEGEVGFNISSLNVLPIRVNVKSFDIAQP